MDSDNKIKQSHQIKQENTHYPGVRNFNEFNYLDSSKNLYLDGCKEDPDQVNSVASKHMLYSSHNHETLENCNKFLNFSSHVGMHQTSTSLVGAKKFKNNDLNNFSHREDIPVHQRGAFQLPVNSKTEEYSQQTTKKEDTHLKCVVCESKANGYNFDAITCESCKAFFRRNAFKSVCLFRCSNNDKCVVDLINRKKCKKCRIMKCFKNGMRRDWIMSEVEREEKRKKIEENRRRKHHTSNMSFSDQDNECSNPYPILNNDTNQDEESDLTKLPIRRRRRRRRIDSSMRNKSGFGKDKNQNHPYNQTSVKIDEKSDGSCENLSEHIEQKNDTSLQQYESFQDCSLDQSERSNDYKDQNLISTPTSLNFYHNVNQSQELTSQTLDPQKLLAEMNQQNPDDEFREIIANDSSRHKPESNHTYNHNQDKYKFNYNFKKFIMKKIEQAQINSEIDQVSTNNPQSDNSTENGSVKRNLRRYGMSEKSRRLVDKMNTAYMDAIVLVRAQGLPQNSNDINTTINLTELAVRRIINFLKLLIEFNDINLETMILLLKNSMMSLLQIHGVNSYDKQNNSFKEPNTDDTPFSADSLQIVYGEEIYNLTISITRNLANVFETDKTHIKLLLLICLFDVSCPKLTFNEQNTIKHYQLKYVKLLYVYLCDKMDLEDADIAFSTIISELNKINELSKWFKSTVDKKSDKDFVRPLMKEIFNLSETKKDNRNEYFNPSVNSEIDGLSMNSLETYNSSICSSSSLEMTPKSNQ